MITRSEFLKGMFAFAGTFGLAGVGCGDDDEGTTATGTATTGNGTTTTGNGTTTTGGGGDGGTTGAGGMAGTGGSDGVSTCTEDIGANHPPGTEHLLEVPPADVEAGVEKSYSIMGNSDHDHTVTLAPSDFEMLAQGTEVEVVSTTELQHTHPVTVTCT